MCLCVTPSKLAIILKISSLEPLVQAAWLPSRPYAFESTLHFRMSLRMYLLSRLALLNKRLQYIKGRKNAYYKHSLVNSNSWL